MCRMRRHMRTTSPMVPVDSLDHIEQHTIARVEAEVDLNSELGPLLRVATWGRGHTWHCVSEDPIHSWHVHYQSPEQRLKPEFRMKGGWGITHHQTDHIVMRACSHIRTHKFRCSLLQKQQYYHPTPSIFKKFPKNSWFSSPDHHWLQGENTDSTLRRSSALLNKIKIIFW